MRHETLADHPVHHGGGGLAPQQEIDDLAREPVALGGSTAWAATDMQDFHHPTISGFSVDAVLHARA
jgi:hypothetical protein